MDGEEKNSQEGPGETPSAAEDEHFLFQLALHAAERGVDPRHQAMVRGAPSPRAELEKEAASSPEARRLFELYRPIDDAAVARMAAEIGPHLRRSNSSSGARGAVRGRRWMRRLGALAAVVAAALAILFLVPNPWRTHDVERPLPEYALELAGAQREMRSAGAESKVALVPAGGQVEIIVRPEAEDRGSLFVEAFVERGGVRAPLVDDFLISEKGVASLAIPADALFAGFEGEVELIVLLKRSEASEGPRRELRTRIRRARAD